MQALTVKTGRRTEFVNITDLVRGSLDGSVPADGVITVFVPHTTAGITINENADPDVTADMESALDRLVPWNAGYRHSEGNAAAHVKASLMGSSVRIPVVKGVLRLGVWQAVYLCEFDGPRSRQVWIM